MGSYRGHVLPGSFFIVSGLWWWFHALALIARAHARFLKHRFNSARMTRSIEFELEFESTTWCKVPVSCLKRFPLEPCLKVITATVGITAELISAEWSLFDKSSGHFANLKNFSHSAMYSIFLLGGVVEILRFYSIIFLPASIDHVLTSLGYLLVGELFYYHIEGRSELDQKLHIMLCFVAFSVTVILLLEAWQRRSFMLFVTRTFLVLLLGTWFIQIAHALFGAQPWQNIESNQAFVVIAFSWHVLGLLVACICSVLAVNVFVRVKRSTCMDRSDCDENFTLATSEVATELHNLIPAEQVNEEVTPIC